MRYIILLLSLAFAFQSCTREQDEKVDEFYHVEVNGAQIPVLLKGNVSNNKIILFLNGGPGLTGIDVGLTNLAHWEENLESEYAVAYFDQRGTGNTLAPIDTSTITLKQFSDDVYAIVKVIKHHHPNAKVYLMAHSFGGLSAADYLIRDEYRAEIRGWICVSGYLVPKLSKNWEYRRNWLHYIAELEIDKGNDIAKWEECLRWLEQTPVIDTDDEKSRWREYVGNHEEGVVKDADRDISTGRVLDVVFSSNYNLFPTYMSKNQLVVLSTIQRHYRNDNYLEKIGNIDVPTLFVWGNYDDLVPFQIGQDAHSAIEHHGKSTFTLMDEAGHEPFLNDRVGFAQTVKDWMKSN